MSRPRRTALAIFAAGWKKLHLYSWLGDPGWVRAAPECEEASAMLDVFSFAVGGSSLPIDPR
jgi:hypothetical protein